MHAPYLINVATTNNRIRIPSRKLLQQHVDAAAAIGARGLIVHGGHVNKDDDPEKGFDNWRKAIEATDLKLPLLIENTAGGDNAMTRYLERIARVWEAISQAEGFDMVGFCLDTCHAHAGGNALETVVDDVVKITGRIDLVHCNDSRDDFDTGADRHANLGAGKVDPDLLAAVVRDAGAPVVVETPGGADEHTADFDWLRERLSDYFDGSRRVDVLAVDLRVDPDVVERAGEDRQGGVARRLARHLALVAEVVALEGREHPDQQPDHQQERDQSAASSHVRQWSTPRTPLPLHPDGGRRPLRSGA